MNQESVATQSATDMTREELDSMAHSIAFENCASLLDSHSLSVREGDIEWWDISGWDYDLGVRHELDQAVKYLDARGLIERHPTRSGLICVMDESEATHPVNLSQSQGGL